MVWREIRLWRASRLLLKLQRLIPEDEVEAHLALGAVAAALLEKDRQPGLKAPSTTR